jgi:hypothetical protein
MSHIIHSNLNQNTKLLNKHKIHDFEIFIHQQVFHKADKSCIKNGCSIKHI